MTDGDGTMNKKSISLRGKVRSIGKEKMDEIFEENPYMAEIYPDPENRDPIEVFQIYEATGELFDLSTKTVTRERFTLGEAMPDVQGYYISDRCRGCKICYSKCPQKCIDIIRKPLVIAQDHCLHCGNCQTFCPFGAVEKK
jgi:NAD-dependent dihydropyrimidine dehydrogenase PreA subunit